MHNVQGHMPKVAATADLVSSREPVQIARGCRGTKNATDQSVSRISATGQMGLDISTRIDCGRRRECTRPVKNGHWQPQLRWR